MSSPAIADLAYAEKSLTANRIDDTGTVIYIGRCTPENYDNIAEPVWQISRFDPTNGEGMKYADNSRDSNKVWNSRSSYF